MQVDLGGQSWRIEGEENPVSRALALRLGVSGGLARADGVPDLLILSAPLRGREDFDWDGLAVQVQSAGAAMKARGSGRMLFLLSATAGMPMRRAPGLSVRMAALEALVRVLAMELAPEVAVNALGIGAVGTENGVFCSGDAVMLGHVPVGRAATVEEICNVALFLCDPDNRYLTGQLLLADGGWAAGYGRSF